MHSLVLALLLLITDDLATNPQLTSREQARSRWD